MKENDKAGKLSPLTPRIVQSTHERKCVEKLEGTGTSTLEAEAEKDSEERKVGIVHFLVISK